jgi:uncharacterized coiled-coil protein SlyX
MPTEEENSHLERRIVKLEKHVAEQDVEIFRQSKLIDSLQKVLKRLEGKIEGISSDSSTTTNEEIPNEKPPHY